MQALFGADHEVERMPEYSKLVLGVTSVWMLIPVVWGDNMVLQVALAVVGLVSTLFWADPRRNSYLYMADKLIAWLYGAILMWFDPNVPAALIVLACFLVSFWCFETGRYHFQLAAHLLFRYCFYCWSYSAIMKDTTVLPLVSIGYVIQILCLSQVYWISFLGSFLLMCYVIADV
jgi:hypothetical protein